MYIFLGRPRTIDELRFQAGLSPTDRARIPILVIDDGDFPYLEILRQNNFNITKVDDVTNVKQVAEYDVVLSDIRGVARSLGSRFEGAHLISEIRQAYPHKYIIAYTSTTFDPQYNSYLASADDMFSKDIDSDASDPSTGWRWLRRRLLDAEVPLYRIMQLEDQFVAFSMGKRTTFPSPALSSNLTGSVRPLLSAFATSVKFVLGLKK